MSKCAACGMAGSTRAHVKDKSECIREGIRNHEYLNIIDLCYNCHYLLFDDRKMGVKKIEGNYFFVFINDQNEVQVAPSYFNLNVREEYIEWKNKRCLPKLLRHLFT